MHSASSVWHAVSTQNVSDFPQSITLENNTFYKEPKSAPLSTNRTAIYHEQETFDHCVIWAPKSAIHSKATVACSLTILIYTLLTFLVSSSDFTCVCQQLNTLQHKIKDTVCVILV